MKESSFQNKVIQFLKDNGAWYVKYWSGSKFTKEGIPDILACIDGTFHGIELKNETGKPSKLQLYNIQKIKESGGEAYVLRPQNYEEWKERWFR